MAFNDGGFENKVVPGLDSALSFTDVHKDNPSKGEEAAQYTAVFEANAAYIAKLSEYIGQIHLRAAAAHPGGLEAFLADHATYIKTKTG
jgi:hypothetical protein